LSELANRFAEAEHIVRLFLWTTPAGIPLTAAVFLLYRRTRATAVILAALCVPLTAVAATVGGLFGPIGITIYSAVCSLPAWLTLGTVALYQNKVAKKRSQQSEI